MTSTPLSERIDRLSGPLLALATLGVFTVGSVIANRVRPALDTSTGLSTTQRENIEKMAAGSLFGQFRSSMADFLWLKVDKYLHSGVDLRGLTPEEKTPSSHADQVQSAPGQQNYRGHRGDETTVVPSAQNDWRGRIGDLERQVAPYMDMSSHTHREAKEALPLFRLMTWSNPHFIPAYVTGASLIAADRKKIGEALAFLSEGEKNNPESVEIQTAIGQMMTSQQRNFVGAFPHLQRAISLGAARDLQTMSEDERDAYRDAFRWLVLNRREAGDTAMARKAAQFGLQVFPGDVVCRHYLAGESGQATPQKTAPL